MARKRRPATRSRLRHSVRTSAAPDDTFLFVCWSGPRSLKLAERLGAFLTQVIPPLRKRIFYSPQIEKGARWFEEVLRHLDAAKVGIICLTPESLAAPWLHFEAGALLKGLHQGPDAQDEAAADATQGRIFTYLHGVTPAMLSGPLAQYQSTSTTRADTRSLVRALSKRIQPESRVYRDLFDRYWPDFERDLAQLHIPVQDLAPEFEGWFRRKTFEEPLQQCTDQNWIGRYEGARQTHERLSGRLPAVRYACPRYQIDLYLQLQALVEAYSMDIRALLIRTAAFPLTESGELGIPIGVLRACENRRGQIKEIVSRLLDPMAVPRTQEAARFWLSDSHDVRKMMVHRCEHELLPASRRGEPGGTRPSEADARKLFESLWDLDRIFGYLLMEHLHSNARDAGADLTRAFAIELERFRAATGATLMPMYYACRALKATLAAGKHSGATDANAIRALFDEARELIEKSKAAPDAEPKLDRGRQLRRVMGEIEARLGPRRRPARRRARPAR